MNTANSGTGTGDAADTRAAIDRLGRIGVWRRGAPDDETARRIEALGYGAIWVGGSPPADLTEVERLLDATSTITVATGIVNIWNADPAATGASYRRIAAKHGDRFLLGVGAGHPEATAEFTKPYAALVDYLDALDAAEVPVGRRVLAALGPKVLKLAGDRTLGAHPYLTTPEHTRRAREILGPDVLLAPEHKVVVETDVEKARVIGRASVGVYLGLSNYVNSLRSLGFTDEDLTAPGSDRLVDALALHGDAATVAAGLTAHLDAGADHVTLQALGDDPLGSYMALAEALSLQGRASG